MSNQPANDGLTGKYWDAEEDEEELELELLDVMVLNRDMFLSKANVIPAKPKKPKQVPDLKVYKRSNDLIFQNEFMNINNTYSRLSDTLAVQQKVQHQKKRRKNYLEAAKLYNENKQLPSISILNFMRLKAISMTQRKSKLQVFPNFFDDIFLADVNLEDLLTKYTRDSFLDKTDSYMGRPIENKHQKVAFSKEPYIPKSDTRTIGYGYLERSSIALMNKNEDLLRKVFQITSTPTRESMINSTIKKQPWDSTNFFQDSPTKQTKYNFSANYVGKSLDLRESVKASSTFRENYYNSIFKNAAYNQIYTPQKQGVKKNIFY